MDKKNRPSVTMLLTEHKWDNIKDFDGNVQKLLLMYWEQIEKMKCCDNCKATREIRGTRTYLPCRPKPFHVCDEWRIYE